MNFGRGAAIIFMLLFLIGTAQAVNLRYNGTNNSVFTFVSETNDSVSLNLTLTGQGVANLTFAAPNITGQTNITMGWTATNATSIKAFYNASSSPNNTIYVITDGTVKDPVIRITVASELSSSNLPVAVLGSAVAGSILIYVLRKRRH